MSETLLLIAAICLVLLTASLIAVVLTILKILSDLREVLKMVRHESEFVAADIHELRQKLKEKAITTSRIASVLAISKAANSFFRYMSRSSKRDRIES